MTFAFIATGIHRLARRPPGFQKQFEWVANGVEEHKGYGVRGISSGRMPHFSAILTKEQIEEIIKFERSL